VILTAIDQALTSIYILQSAGIVYARVWNIHSAYVAMSAMSVVKASSR